MKKLDIPLVILAGGESKRMQRDKALLPFANYNTILEYHLDSYKDFFSCIFISTNVNSKTRDIKHKTICDFILDKYDVRSPMVALGSIMEFLKQDFMVMSVDTPFINKQVFNEIYAIYKEKNKAPIICMNNNRMHPLCGLYSYESLDMVNSFILDSNHKMQNLLAKLDPMYLELDGDFFNMNTPQDYDIANSKSNL